MPKNDQDQTNDMLTGQDWSHFVGASQNKGKVTVMPLNRTIQPLNGGAEQPNPPVNLSGPHLVYNDDFNIKFVTSGLNKGDAIRLYGAVPIIYDEWRLEPASVEVRNDGSNYKVSLWDGSGKDPTSIQKFSLKEIPKELRFEKSGDRLLMMADNKLVFEINAKPLLRSGKIWFGLSAQETEFRLKQLSVSSHPGAVKVERGLNSSAQKSSSYARIKLGAAVSLNPLLTDQKYRDVAQNQFSIWTPENELKAQFIHPSQNNYSFQEADLLVDTAITNNIAIHGHALVFGEANPPWIRSAPDSEKRSIMIDHINTVVTHYKGKIQEWDVVNEPLSDEDEDYQAGGNGLRQNLWYKAIGPEYIAIALKTAYAANPQAKLYINDFGLEQDGPRWQAMLKLIDSLQSQGVPIDGVGFEAHIHESADRVNAGVLSRHMQELAKRGLSARISEIDVYGDDGTAKQAKDYTTVLEACLSRSNCVAYSTWGITDKYGSTTDYKSYPPDFGNDLLWDSSIQPKPAYWQISKMLKTGQ